MNAKTDRDMWKLVQSVVTGLGSMMPDWVIRCACLDYEEIRALPVNGAGQGVTSSPNVEAREVAGDYLGFLREQISLAAEGPEWTEVLRRRLAALEPYEGKMVLTAMFWRAPEWATIRIDPESGSLIDYERG
jgi:hypothetical protein